MYPSTCRQNELQRREKQPSAFLRPPDSEKEISNTLSPLLGFLYISLSTSFNYVLGNFLTLLSLNHIPYHHMRPCHAMMHVYMRDDDDDVWMSWMYIFSGGERKRCKSNPTSNPCFTLKRLNKLTKNKYLCPNFSPLPLSLLSCPFLRVSCGSFFFPLLFFSFSFSCFLFLIFLTQTQLL